MAQIFSIIDIGASGLSAQRSRLNAISQNIANVETTKTPEGTPYKRRQVVFRADEQNKRFIDVLNNSVTSLTRTHRKHMPNAEINASRKGELELVEASEVEIEPEAFKMIYDPTHPDADENGYVAMPDIDLIAEMVDMMTATRAYEADVAVVQSAKDMAMQALDI